MKSSTICFRVADFLRQYPPFNEMEEADLLDLATSGKVKFHEDDEFIFRQGSKCGPYLYVIQQGSVRLLEQSGERELLRDLLGTGDLVGIGQLLGEVNYHHSAKSVGDLILYAIRSDIFLALIKRYPKAVRYLAAYFSVKTDTRFTLDEQGVFLPRSETAHSCSWLQTVFPLANFPQMNRFCCTPDTSIANAARLMREQRVEAIAIVDQDGCALGLITLEDLRDCIAMDKAVFQDPVQSIMRQSLIFASPGQTAGEYLLQLLSSGTRHIGITQDGHAESRLLALFNERDLTLHSGHNPVALAERIATIDSASQLAPVRAIMASMLTSGLAETSVMAWYTSILTQLDSLIMLRLFLLAEESLTEAGRPVPEIDYCWLLFGPAGRRELLIHRRPRLGLIYADPDEKNAASVKDYFSALISCVETMLEAAGYPTIDDHPTIHHSLSSWQKQFSDWINDPIMSRTYLSLDAFDLSPIGGDGALTSALEQHIQSELACNENHFIPLMANDAMAHLPPLTFFQGQIIDDHGAQHEDFDLFQTTLQPLVDMARVFSLEQGAIGGAPTDLRLEQYAEAHPAEQTLFKESAEAFRVALMLQARIADANNDDGLLVNPDKLDKYEQQLLKSIFRNILALLEKCASHFDLVPRR